MDINVQQLVACKYDELPQHTPVINAMNIEYYLWIKLPEYIDETYSFFEIQEIQPMHLNLVLDERSNRIKRERICWIRIIFQILGLSHGQHIYKLRFVNKENDVVTLYFSYIIQNDDVKRPYMYMNRRKRCCCRHDCNLCG